jgi:hypothetical protein
VEGSARWFAVFTVLAGLLASVFCQKPKSPTTQPVTLSSISCYPATVGGGTFATLNIFLTGIAPAAGVTVQLSANSKLVSVTPYVTVPAGSQGIGWTINTYATSVKTAVTITAISGSVTQTALITVVPAYLASLTVTPSVAVGGSQTTVEGVVTFNGVPAVYSTDVALKSSNPRLVIVPASVKLESQATFQRFVVRHKVVTTQETVTITATSNGITKSTILTLTPFEVTFFRLSPTSVNGGLSSIGELVLNGAPGSDSGPIVVDLSSSVSLVAIPKTIRMAIGAVSQEFGIPTEGTQNSTTAALTASYGVSKLDTTLTVLPPVLKGMGIKPDTVKGSSRTVVEVTLNLVGKAPIGGLDVELTSSDPSAVSIESKVLVPAGKSSATFTVSHKKVTAQTVVTLSATANGGTVTAPMVVTP